MKDYLVSKKLKVFFHTCKPIQQMPLIFFNRCIYEEKVTFKIATVG